MERPIAPSHPQPDLRLAHRMLGLLAAWHALFWVLAPMLVYRSLPLDTLELLGWGQAWEWGYYKHPPLGAWLGEAVFQASGGWLPSLYLLAQGCVLLCGLYVWRLARLVVDPVRAALAVLLLEGAYAYTWLTPNFNMNLLQLPAWAGFSYHLLRALSGTPRHWLWAGVWGAACLLSKYSGLLLLASTLALLLVDPRARTAWRTPWFYAGCLLGASLLIPHALWLLDHWRLPLAYLQSFDAGPKTAVSHLEEPLRFLVGSLAGLTVTGLLTLTLRDRGAERPQLRLPLVWVTVLLFGPLLLSCLYGAFSGSRMKSTWAFPFFNLAGLWLCAVLPMDVSQRRLRRFATTLGVTALAIGGLHLAYKLSADKSKTGFDGRALAERVEACWGAKTQRPLHIVAGDHILTSYVNGYATTRPWVWINADSEIAPWVTRDRLRSLGAVRVCRVDGPCANPAGFDWQPACTVKVDAQSFEVSWFAPDSAGAPPSSSQR